MVAVEANKQHGNGPPSRQMHGMHPRGQLRVFRSPVPSLLLPLVVPDMVRLVKCD